MTKEELNKVLAEVIDEALEIDIPVPSNIYPEIIINSRPKKRYGCCKNIKGTFYIEVSSFILNCQDDKIRNVIAHEVLHSCRDCDNHGVLWQRYAYRMNCEYGYNIKRTSTFEEMGLEMPRTTPKIKYIMKCQSCGKEYPRQRYTCVMKKINAYRCSCGGELKIFTVNYR